MKLTFTDMATASLQEAAAVGLPSDTDDDADVPGPSGSKEDSDAATQEAPKPFAGGWGAAFLADKKQANQKASEDIQKAIDETAGTMVRNRL